MHEPLPALQPAAAREAHYAQVLAGIYALLEGEDDWIAAMASVAGSLHQAFGYFDWTGFYRAVGDDLLVIGPYQGGHGCLRIPFAKGVCGAAARTRETQRVADVDAFPGHIACASSTRAELVVPLVSPSGRLLGVLDVDSDTPDAFDAVDQAQLEGLCRELATRYAETPVL